MHRITESHLHINYLHEDSDTEAITDNGEGLENSTAYLGAEYSPSNSARTQMVFTQAGGTSVKSVVRCNPPKIYERVLSLVNSL